MFGRWLTGRLRARLRRPYVHLVFGARQTGKSTLLRALLPPNAFRLDLANPEERNRYLARPGDFLRDCEALPHGRVVFVDEAQAVPALFDAVQHLWDRDRAHWRFVLCGSSARKLRATGANLLPGRSLVHRLFPLLLVERPAPGDRPPVPSPLPMPGLPPAVEAFPQADLSTRLAFGDLPGIATAAVADRAALLKSYALVHLEEEIRREALIRDWGAFVRFLRLAAAESGSLLNYAAISQESGLSQPTVKAYYQLLEDMFVAFRVPAFSHSPRKNLLSTPKFLFFDLGVRHAAAGLTPSRHVVEAAPGALFEQWVGIELWKRLQYLGDGTLHHLRSRDGAEIDFVVERKGKLTAVAAKWTEHPSPKDARHLRAFLEENRGRAAQAYVVCRCPRPMHLGDRITALPWSLL
jgi:uncharacterized protein